MNLLSGPVFHISFIQQRSSGLHAGGLLFGGLILEGREEEGEQHCFIPVQRWAEPLPLLVGHLFPVQGHSGRTGSRGRGLGQGGCWAPAESL